MSVLQKKDLDQFTGTSRYYRHRFAGQSILITDGVHYLADAAGAYWLLDAITTWQSVFNTVGFQVWELIKHSDDTALLTMMEDIGQPLLVRQKIVWTDFPLDKVKLYLIDGVLLLPSEY